MKVLQISPHMTCNQIPLMSRCQSGFGYMVYDITRSTAEKVEVHAFLYNYRYNAFNYENIHFEGARLWGFLRNIFSCVSIGTVFSLFNKYKIKNRTKIRLIYMWLLSGRLKKIIQHGKYDIIHLHGCVLANEILIEAFKELNQRYIVTLHGLNSFSDTVNLETAGKEYERDFLKEVVEGKHHITVISSGMKKVIEDCYHTQQCKNITVINNAFSFTQQGKLLNIREKYSLPSNSKILLYIGNLCIRKNQQQIIEAFDLLNDDIKSNTYVLFLGKELGDVDIPDLIEKSKYREHFILCGNVDKKDIPSYYKEGNGVVLISISEGFGLSLIEGMHFGLPAMTFTDVDAYNDIYSPVAMIGVSSHDNHAVAKGLETLLTSEWDRKSIQDYSKKFGIDTMADNYIKLYSNN